MLPPGWMPKFIEALAVMPNVRVACEVAGVSRATAYRKKARVAAFSRLWDKAIEEGCDRLEQEAWRRAVGGVTKPVYQGGKKVGDVKEYSDRLLEQLLKAHRPEKYRERIDMHVQQGSEVDREIVELTQKLKAAARGAPVPTE